MLCSRARRRSLPAAADRSNRRAARWRRHRAIDAHVELIMGMGSFLALGGKRACPRNLVRPETVAHLSAIAHVRKQVTRFVRLMAPASWMSAIGSGRRGPALQASIAQLSRWVVSSSAGATGYYPDALRSRSLQCGAGEPDEAREHSCSPQGQACSSPCASEREHATYYEPNSGSE